MAGIFTSFSNIGILVGSLYPYFIVCFLVLASIFNQKLNGLVYLGGIVTTAFICYLISFTGVAGKNGRLPNAALTCDFFNLFNNQQLGPSALVATSWFTFIYLLIPMLPPVQPNGLINPMVVILTAFFAIVSSIFQIRNNCNSMTGILLGGIIGLIMGVCWFFLWWSTNHHDLLFYNEIVSNNAVCSRPQKQSFKCEVWKGGELISQSTV